MHVKFLQEWGERSIVIKKDLKALNVTVLLFFKKNAIIHYLSNQLLNKNNIK